MTRQKSRDPRRTTPHRRAGVQTGGSPSAEARQVKKSTAGSVMREIEAHPTELEMQNEALSASRAETEATRLKYERLYRKYASLFDFAPIGYLIVDRNGVIGELNLAAAIMLDAPRSVLTGRRITDFIHRDDQDGYYFQKLNCQKNRETANFELKMSKADGHLFNARLQMQAISRQYDEEPRYLLSLVDISEHVQLSSSFAMQQDCLEFAYRASDMNELLGRYVQRVKAYLQCDAVGIRIRDEDGSIPYQAYDGFSAAFYESESPLSLHTDQCLCIAVIKGDMDAKSPFVTAKGSIYINGTSRFMATVPAEERGPSRNVCNAHGYESIALVPIIIDDTVEGLIHAADRRENRFPLRVIETLEQVATRLGLAIQRFYLQEKLNESLAALNALSCHLITVQEDEQRRIAMELHDGCGQDLNVLKLRLKGLQDRLPADATDLIQTCDQLLMYSDKIINDIRNIAHGLKPATLDVLGLAVASRQMIHEFSSYSRIEVETNIDLLDRIRNPMDQVCLYRIFQEALTNIHKHARASWVWVAANREGNKMHITIQDNGIGFDNRRQPDRVDGEKGLGLSTLKLRCQMIGAKLSIHSKPGKGTRLTICLPWPQQASER
jgi:PAS domain S-box-containing protein